MSSFRGRIGSLLSLRDFHDLPMLLHIAGENRLKQEFRWIVTFSLYRNRQIRLTHLLSEAQNILKRWISVENSSWKSISFPDEHESVTNIFPFNQDWWWHKIFLHGTTKANSTNFCKERKSKANKVFLIPSSEKQILHRISSPEFFCLSDNFTMFPNPIPLPGEHSRSSPSIESKIHI